MRASTRQREREIDREIENSYSVNKIKYICAIFQVLAIYSAYQNNNSKDRLTNRRRNTRATSRQVNGLIGADARMLRLVDVATLRT